MMIKYPIHKVAKDFKHGSKELPSKEVMDILTQYGHPPKNHMQPLTEQELSIVFEYLTQHNQVESIASIYEDVYHEPAKPAAQQAKQAPAAHQKGGASKQPTHSQQPAAPKGGKQAPVQQQGRAGGKPQQQAVQSQPASRIPAKKVVDTRGSGAVNLDKYDERLESFTTERQQQGGGKQKFQGRNAQRQRGRQQGPGNKRKQEEAEKMRRLQLEIAKKAPLKVMIPDEIGVGELASRMKKTGAEVVKCLIKNGVMASLSDIIDFDTASIIAEVDDSRITTRYTQGWVTHRTDSLDEALSIAQEHLNNKTACAVAYHGNVVDLLEFLYDKGVHVDLMSDQTSCHMAYDGGYCPQGLTFEQRTEMLDKDPEGFAKLVDKSLKHHYEMICKFHEKGTYFFDYGNAFLKSVYDAGVPAEKICKNGENDLDGFVFPSYVEDILGPTLFDFGYGPFRWCCLSRKPEDLAKTDEAAAEYIKAHTRRYQDHDNYVWVRDAGKNKMVVGTQCRILYSDAMGRMNLALKFNEMVRNGEIGPVMLGRDHHDTGGTDSPFRETSNIKDGSNIMADMATQCYAGNAARGMSLIALHNGGGVGVSKSINGGFGMVLDGSERVDQILKMSMPWDVMVGVARRSWARNENALTTAAEYNKLYEGQDHISLPYVADDAVVESAVKTMKG